MLALWHAYRTYETTKGNVGTFLNYQIRYRLIDFQRKKMRDQEVVAHANHEEQIKISPSNRCKKTNQILIDIVGIDMPDTAFWDEVRKGLSKNQWKWVSYFNRVKYT